MQQCKNNFINNEKIKMTYIEIHTYTGKKVPVQSITTYISII